MLKNIVIGLFFFYTTTLISQDFRYNFGFKGFVDNREYYNIHSIPQTIFGARTFADVGFKVNNNQWFGAGFNYLYEFGSYDSIIKPEPVLFFAFKKEPYEFYIGSFNRDKLLNYPNALLNDTLKYYRPNIEGLYFKYLMKRGYEKIWIDWTSRQTDLKRETFLFGLSGKSIFNNFFISHYLLMYHYARSAKPIAGEYIRDNGALLVNVGYCSKELAKFDNIEISTGIMMGIDRNRSFYNWRLPLGLFSQLDISKEKVGLTETLYIGDNQDIMYGDGLYKSGRYSRTDLYFIPIKNDFVTSKLMFSFHILDGTLNYSQSFVLTMKIKEK